MTTISTPRDEKNKNRKPEDSSRDTDEGNGGETFGKEPPVRDPKPSKAPDSYEFV